MSYISIQTEFFSKLMTDSQRLSIEYDSKAIMKWELETIKKKH